MEHFFQYQQEKMQKMIFPYFAKDCDGKWKESKFSDSSRLRLDFDGTL